MRIQATIEVEYDVDPENYQHLVPEKCSQEEVIQIIELHKLSTVIAEAMPWPAYDKNDQVLKIKLEE